MHGAEGFRHPNLNSDEYPLVYAQRVGECVEALGFGKPRVRSLASWRLQIAGGGLKIALMLRRWELLSMIVSLWRAVARLSFCRRLVLGGALMLAGVAWGQQSLEIIPLRHRPAAEVLPTLQPLLEPGASLTGSGYQLFLRASPRNRAEVKEVLAVLDAPQRRLLIRVSTDVSEVERDRAARLALAARMGGESRANVKIYDSRSASSASQMQMVQTVDGGRAFIQVGTSVAVPLRQVVLTPGGAVLSDRVEYRDIAQGFYVEPRLAGDRVTLEISQQQEQPAQWGPGSAHVQRLSTTVSGRLGEWLQLGGSGESAIARERGIVSLSSGAVRSERGIWLLVEEAP